MKNRAFALPKLSDNKEYVEAEAKLNALQLQLVEAENKRNAILADINAPRPHRDPIQEAARKMLDGDRSPLSDDTSKKLRESYQELSTRITVLHTAIQMQRKVVDQLVSAASFKAVELAQPTHRENVRNVVAKLKALDEALTAERDLRDGLIFEGFAVSLLRPMGLPRLGLLRDGYSTVSLYLMEAYREGFIDAGELPENLQKMLPPAPGAKKPVIEKIKAKFDDWTPA
jgi:hypothetical protein